jgi:hypothetical protein
MTAEDWKRSRSGPEVPGNLANEVLEGQLPDEEFGRVLPTTTLSQSNGTGAEPARLLHATSCL